MPPYRTRAAARVKSAESLNGHRITLAIVLIALAWLALIGRFFQLQILEHHSYEILASDQHEIQSALIPKRGTIFLRDPLDGTLYPVAKDRDAWQVYAVPRDMKGEEAQGNASAISAALGIPEADLLAKLSVTTSTYTVLAKDVPLEKIDGLRQSSLPGIGISKILARQYPEPELGGHYLGFVMNEDRNLRTGKYGVEGYMQDTLAGEVGSIQAEKDAAGRRLSIGTISMKEAKDGSDIVLTINRAIQFQVCQAIQQAIKTYEAEGGSAIVMDPQTGAVLAMCSAPDYDSAAYGKIGDLSVLNNPATFYQFEPGSIFKPITLAAGIDAGKITPQTTYTDTGSESIDGFTIHNSDKQAHGVRTMSEVLEMSLNTGTIFVQRLLGQDLFRNYVEQFGFGEKTGIEVSSEAKGNISPLSRKGKVFAATASYGQGISVTPIQMAAAYSALGNGGLLMKPYLVQEIIHPDGTHEIIKPQVVRRVISERSSRLISAMLVNVVEKGHGKKAAVAGYYVAGKTGTAQIASANGQGYLPDDQTIGSFTGFAPADNPKFVLIVKMDKPKVGAFAESSAAPVFGELAKFLLTYFEVPPERPITEKPAPAVTAPKQAATTAATASSTKK